MTNIHPSTHLFAVSNADSLSENDYQTFFKTASKQRQERVLKFLRREDACRSLTSEALVKYAIASATVFVVKCPHFITNE